MNNLTINIGLNVNNIQPKRQYHNTTLYLNRLFNNTTIKICEGEWKGIKEKVIIASINAGELNSLSVQLLLSWLCTELEQDAISYKLNNEGRIAFDPLYTGEQFQFNEEMFINF